MFIMTKGGGFWCIKILTIFPNKGFGENQNSREQTPI